VNAPRGDGFLGRLHRHYPRRYPQRANRSSDLPIGGTDENAVHAIGDPLCHARRQMAIRIDGRRHRGVAKQLAHDSKLLPFLKQQRCAGVPEVVESLRLQPRPAQRGVEGGEDVSAVPRIAMRAGEDEVLLVPTGPRCQSILKLCLAARFLLRFQARSLTGGLRA